jgi:hypothetical protein
MVCPQLSAEQRRQARRTISDQTPQALLDIGLYATQQSNNSVGVLTVPDNPRNAGRRSTWAITLIRTSRSTNEQMRRQAGKRQRYARADVGSGRGLDEEPTPINDDIPYRISDSAFLAKARVESYDTVTNGAQLGCRLQV